MAAILRDMIQYYNKYILSHAVAPDLGYNRSVPLFQNVRLESESFSFCNLFLKHAGTFGRTD